MIRRTITAILLMLFPLFCSPPDMYAALSVDKPLPRLGDLDLRTPEGEQVFLIPYIGRQVVVVVFWATWCPICKDEVPRLKQLDANPDVKVIAVNEGESIGKVKRFIADNNIGYQVVMDPKASLAKAFAVPGMPYCAIIGRSGVIEYRGSGLPANLDSYLQQK